MESGRLSVPLSLEASMSATRGNGSGSFVIFQHDTTFPHEVTCPIWLHNLWGWMPVPYKVLGASRRRTLQTCSGGCWTLLLVTR
eukprot:970329-Rhodomonas_salina.1